MTHRFNACAVMLALAALGTLPRCCGAEEARAATRAPTADSHDRLSADGLLGALSFTAGREPISLIADALEFDYRSRVLTYKGGVEATQGDMKLQSNTLTLSLDDRGENRLKEVVATGDVRLSKGSRWATAGRAVFDQQQRIVTLSDNAVLHDGPNQVTGEEVTVYLNEERSVVKGGNGRVKALLFPPQSEATPPAEGAAR